MLNLLTPIVSRRSLLGLVLLFFISLFLGACSEEKTVETTPPDEKPALSDADVIQTVIEKEFNGPDETYKKLLNTAMEGQTVDMSQEDYDAYMETPAYQDLVAYTEETYSEFFTDNGFEKFIKTTPAFMYHSFDGDYTLKTSNIEVVQNEQEPTLYTFTFQVDYSTSETEAKPFNFEGKAIVPEAGKIGDIQFLKNDGLLDEMNRSLNGMQ